MVYGCYKDYDCVCDTERETRDAREARAREAREIREGVPLHMH
jgi:hypothetical protein